MEEDSGALSDNHLRKELLELNERMARLEGLVLDLVGQLVPAITRFFIQLPPDHSKAVSPPSASLPPGDALEPPAPEEPPSLPEKKVVVKAPEHLTGLPRVPYPPLPFSYYYKNEPT